MKTNRNPEQLNILNQLSKYLDFEIHYFKKLLISSQKAEMNREIAKIENFLETMSSEIKWNYQNDMLIQQILKHYKTITGQIKILSDFVGEKEERLRDNSLFEEISSSSEKCKSIIIREIKNMLLAGEDENTLIERFDYPEVQKSSGYLYDVYLELVLKATFSNYILQIKDELHFDIKNAFESLSDEDVQSIFTHENIFGEDTRLKYNDTVLKRYSIDIGKWDFYQLAAGKKRESNSLSYNELENFLNWMDLNQDSIYNCLKYYILNLLVASLLVKAPTPKIDELDWDQIMFSELLNTSTVISGSLADY
ncbi:unnamed protein product [Blepharisma stoltei]|uniref:Uncharacterized protein n=1 Tax=Blepharisma stoltei TaxID=1481888 RepID=A0AAU9JUM1_9CILI|nr:unnamed protein product [Blepharisma stoltei]